MSGKLSVAVWKGGLSDGLSITLILKQVCMIISFEAVDYIIGYVSKFIFIYAKGLSLPLPLGP